MPLTSFQVSNMENYKLTLRLPKSYNRHISTLRGIMRKKNNNDVVKELIDEKMSKQFSNNQTYTIQ